MKIKDNLDLQGYLLQNFCVDNYDSLDGISNKGDGRMVFLTGNSTDAKYRHVNVWDGTNFKALAYLEDVAMNDDFIALQEKVALLAGDVDTDAIISNMKEVSAFLEGFEEDASLMNYLTSELGKKLDKSGGTIEGDVVLNGNLTITRGSSPLYLNVTSEEYPSAVNFFRNLVNYGGLGMSKKNTPSFFDTNNTPYTLLHAGNYSDYALPLTGGYVKGATTILGRFKLDGGSILEFVKKDSTSVMLRGNPSNTELQFYNGTSWHDVLHSGNIGSQSVQSAKDALRFKGLASSGDLNTVLAGGGMARAYNGFLTGDFTNAPSGAYYGTVLQLSTVGFVETDALSGQLAWDVNHNSTTDATRYLWWRASDINGFTNSKWHQIAFTDSDITGNAATATKLATPRTIWGQSFDGTGNVSGSINGDVADFRVNAYDGSVRYNIIDADSNNAVLYFGYGSAPKSYKTRIAGESVVLHYGTSKNVGLILNASGSVTLGSEDKAKEVYKLHVAGPAYLHAYDTAYGTLGGRPEGSVVIGTDNYGLISWSRNDGNTLMQVARFDDTATAYNLILQHLGGNVLIGTTNEGGSGAKLHVAGLAYASILASVVSVSLNRNPQNGNIYDSAKLALAIENSSSAITFNEYNADGSKIGTPVVFSHQGFVGIGKADPTQRLDVNGNILIPNYSALMSRKVDGTVLNLIYAGNDDVIKIGGILPIKLQGNTTIGGDLHVTGNIIADGEVSAGGAGEEGSASGSGAGAFHSENIAVGATQTTIAHGLGTDDIVVSIYEKDATSGLWSMILTDIEITDADNIRVTFGSATTVEHKVVIMGAVA